MKIFWEESFFQRSTPESRVKTDCLELWELSSQNEEKNTVEQLDRLLSIVYKERESWRHGGQKWPRRTQCKRMEGNRERNAGHCESCKL